MIQRPFKITLRDQVDDFTNRRNLPRLSLEVEDVVGSDFFLISRLLKVLRNCSLYIFRYFTFQLGGDIMFLRKFS